MRMERCVRAGVGYFLSRRSSLYHLHTIEKAKLSLLPPMLLKQPYLDDGFSCILTLHLSHTIFSKIGIFLHSTPDLPHR
ncbi:MAG: hypothetical protein QXI19_03570, partial [Candidatus Caldarchaeum sp.]